MARTSTAMSDEDVRRTRPQLQMIFQDPISSLNPRRKVRDIVGEGLAIWPELAATAGRDRRRRSCAMSGSTRYGR